MIFCFQSILIGSNPSSLLPPCNVTGWLETNKCTLITALLFVLKIILDAIAQALIKVLEGGATVGTGGAAVAAVAAKEVFCRGLLDGTGGAFWLSLMFTGIKTFFQETYEYFLGKDQGVKLWKTLAGE